jgi:DNA-binding CsgD family transcriptional regulator
MFGTELKLTTFIFTCLEIIVLFFQLPNYLSRRQDKSRFRFLILIIAFIFYNLCSGLLPDNRIPLHILAQNVLAFGSGILLATYYFYYLVHELNISQEKLFNTKVLFWSLVLSFVIGFILTYLLTGNISLSKRNFIFLPVLISIYFCITTIKFLAKNKIKQKMDTPFKLMVYSGYIGIIFMASMPIVVFFGDYQTLNNALVNISFVITFYAYIKLYLFQSKLEYNLLNKVGFFGIEEKESSLLHQSGLSERQLTVAYLMLKGLTQEEIAEELFLVTKTVSKHASNIYKKTNTKNIKDFLRKFKGENSANKISSETIEKQELEENPY